MNLWKLFGIGEKITPIPQEKKMILMYVRSTMTGTRVNRRFSHNKY